MFKQETNRLTVAFAFLVLVTLSAARAQKGAFDWSAPTVQTLAPGILYSRFCITEPRPVRMHLLRIDTRTPGLLFTTTGRAPGWKSGSRETIRETTREFIASSRKSGKPVIVAINASAWDMGDTAWDAKIPADLAGLVIADGKLISEPTANRDTFFIRADGSAGITSTESWKAPQYADLTLAVSGFGMVLEGGTIKPSTGENLAPCTGIGVSADGQSVYIVVADGRQYDSEGLTMSELGEWLKFVGSSDALAMDGGGSTTLAAWNETSSSIDLLNQPVGNRQSYIFRFAYLFFGPTERANGNNLGVYFAPHP